MWLKTPVEETDKDGGKRLTGGKRSKLGTPQGGVISPLLANVYMNRFLKYWLAPFGLPLCPGLNWCSRGGHPGPTRYSVFGERGLIVVRDAMRFRCEEVVAVIASSEFAVAGVPTSRRSACFDWRARSCQPEAAARARGSGAGRAGWRA